MKSLEMLERLDAIPLSVDASRVAASELAMHAGKLKGDLFAVEVGLGIEDGIGGLFDVRNVPDDLIEAYKLASPSIAEKFSLSDRYLEMVDRGPDSVTGFVSNLKGKLAELRIPDLLEEEFPGYSFQVAASQNQPVWDIVATGPDGAEIFIQSKVGGIKFARDVLERMQEDPDVLFAVSSEIRDSIIENHKELASQFVDFDLSDSEFSAATKADLELLANNFGIDLPDEVGDILPWVGEILLGIRLLIDVIRTEKDLKEVKLSEKSRVHVLRTLTILQRFGVSAVMITLGATAGTAAFPGVGSVLGGVGGAFSAGWLNKRLKPRYLELAYWAAGMTEDDVFYLRFKKSIDGIGFSLSQTTVAVA